MRILRIGLAFCLLVWTWMICVFHLGVFLAPAHDEVPANLHSQVWIPKEKFGIHQLVLTGSPFERGLAAGKLTAPLLLREEVTLTEKLREFFPNPLVLRALQTLMVRWFWGADRYFEEWMLQEMDGVSRSAPHEFDSYANPYVRQIYYHGLHEVGQMMVDQTGDSMGCTVAALPSENGWVLGRNFDFEAGPIFDSDKIMKWVFPDQGNAYVSVIWAGMVGAVTGVNDHGVYISINAAGAKDFKRYGTPTTLVVLKALQFANDANQAVEIIRSAETFITDIFVVSDPRTNRLFRVEKSPHHAEVIELHGPSVVTNHLVSPYFRDDSINRFRRYELTSEARTVRAEELIRSVDLPKLSQSSQAGGGSKAVTAAENASKAVVEILRILRDKSQQQGQPLAFGNRLAIDAMIATHAVIYDSAQARFYVSQGPALVGVFAGFDLIQSFKRKEPVAVPGLGSDPVVPVEQYAKVKRSYLKLSQAESALRHHRCDLAQGLIVEAGQDYDQSYNFAKVLGDEKNCLGDSKAAIEAWRQALERHPAYASERSYLKMRLGLGENQHE